VTSPASPYRFEKNRGGGSSSSSVHWSSSVSPAPPSLAPGFAPSPSTTYKELPAAAGNPRSPPPPPNLFSLLSSSRLPKP
jgi:hypothetical protein